MLLFKILNVLLCYERYRLYYAGIQCGLNMSICHLSWLVLDFISRVDYLLRSRNKVAEID